MLETQSQYTGPHMQLQFKPGALKSSCISSEWGTYQHLSMIPQRIPGWQVGAIFFSARLWELNLGHRALGCSIGEDPEETWGNWLTITGEVEV